MRGLRRGISLLAIMVLLMGQMLPAAAIPMGGGNPGGGEGSPRPDISIGAWGELKDWLWDAGGKATLTGDIVLPAGESAYVPAIFLEANAVLDCGTYTIYVEGGLFLEGALGLTVCGAGGEAGLFHVRGGGELALSYLTLTASSGAALVQEEGSLVTLASGESNEGRVTVTGDVRFATMPVLSKPQIKGYMDTPYVIIPEGTDYAPLLPQTRQANLYFKGELVMLGANDSQDGPYGFQQAVAWEIPDNQAEMLAERKRTLLGGRFVGALSAPGFPEVAEDYRALFDPGVLVVFPVDGAALLECGFASKTETLRLAFTFSPAPEAYRLLRSDDEGESWTALSEESIPEGSEETRWELIHYLETEEERAAWYLVEGQYTNDKGVRLVHTDTIAVGEADVLPVTWVDGHRGGGEDIVGIEPPPSPPAVIRPPDPPQSGGEDEAAGGEEGTEMPPLLGALPPPEPTDHEPVPAAAQPEVPPPAPRPLVQEGAQEAVGTVRTRARTHQEGEVETATQAQTVLPTETPKLVPVKVKAELVAPQSPPEVEPIAPQEERTHALTPGAQIAIGCGILALLGSGAVLAINPGVVKILFHRHKDRH